MIAMASTLTSTSLPSFTFFAVSHVNPRFDYIARDCHAVGEKRNITMTR